MYLKIIICTVAMFLGLAQGAAQSLGSSYTCNFAKIKPSSGKEKFRCR